MGGSKHVSTSQPLQGRVTIAFGLPGQILDLLCTRHKLCVDVELSASPSYEMAVL